MRAGPAFSRGPLFRPRSWGGQWIGEVCDCPTARRTMHGVLIAFPEENSLLLDMAGMNIEIPAMDLGSPSP